MHRWHPHLSLRHLLVESEHVNVEIASPPLLNLMHKMVTEGFAASMLSWPALVNAFRDQAATSCCVLNCCK